MHRAWINTEGLPEIRTQDYPKLVNKWVEATGEFPGERTAPPNFWTSSDGIELAYRELGEGRPVILLHGLFSDSLMNWVNFGHAERIAAAGFRVITPDLRAHGLSGKPHEPEHYPKGVLARDLRELIAHLGPRRFRPGRVLLRSAHGGGGGRGGLEAAQGDPCRNGAARPAQLGCSAALLP